jgi:hypothetical protein
MTTFHVFFLVLDAVESVVKIHVVFIDWLSLSLIGMYSFTSLLLDNDMLITSTHAHKTIHPLAGI